MGLAASMAAYSEGAEWFDAAKAYIWDNVLFTEKYLSEHCPKIRVVKPEGSYLVWLDFHEFTELTDREISERILRKAKVWLDYGRMFGEEGEKFQRINVATPALFWRRLLNELPESLPESKKSCRLEICIVLFIDKEPVRYETDYMRSSGQL